MNILLRMFFYAGKLLRNGMPMPGISAILALSLLGMSGMACANVTITTATGGNAIASNTAPGCNAAGTWTTLTNPRVAEGNAGDIGVGNIVLTAPAGFEFNTAAAVTISLAGNNTNTRNINDIANGSTVAVTSITSTQITFTVTHASTSRNTLTWQGIQVRPTVSTPLASGNITETGSSVLTGATSTTNFGSLTEVTSTPACTNPVPTTTGISPSSKFVGDAAFSMTVNGTNFLTTSQVQLNGSNRTTSYVSATQLTVAILASDMTAAGTSSITVVNPAPGGGTSNAQTFTVTIFCSPPSNIPAGVSVTCECDTFNRATLNPSTIFNSNWTVSTSDATGILPSIVNPGYLRLTNNTGNNAKAATVPGIFPAAGNYISVEFQQYAYNGSGADGIAVTLSDYSVPAVPGAFGGSLGYAQKTGGACPTAPCNGFAGGWIGVALDEFGNYQNATEGRIGGVGFVPQSVGVRGSGSGVTGYNYLAGTAGLNPQIDNAGSTTPSRGYYYQVIVDARNVASTSVAVNRDAGTGYSPLISIPNVYSAATAQGFTQAAVPSNWQISFTGSTGGSTNIHEIGGLRICAQTVWPPTGGTASGFSAIDEVYPLAANSVPAYQNFQTGHIYMKMIDSDPTNAASIYKFKLWVAALTSTAISSGYSAVTPKYVRVNLVDNSDNQCGPDSARTCNAACTGKTAVETGASQIVTFATGGPGASLSPSFSLKSSWRNLIAVMKECTTSACTAYTATASACSVDSFSVRPAIVSSVTSSNATNAGSSGTPIFKAGLDNFVLTATIAGVAGYPNGYTGNLKIDNAVLQPVAPASTAGSVTGTFAAATSSTPASTATGNTFTYSEAGAFSLPGYDPATDFTSRRGVFDGVDTTNECTSAAQCDALRAATWTGLDSISSKGDCILDNYRNTRDLSGTVASNSNYGKFGCSFGLIANTAGFGRFVPDHFDTVVKYDTVTKMFMPCPAGLTCPASGDPVYTWTYPNAAARIAATGFAATDIGKVAVQQDDNTFWTLTAVTPPTQIPTWGGFVYSGQAFTTQVTARNALGATTVNYASPPGGLAKTVTLSAWNAKGGNIPSAVGALANNSITAGFVAGVANTVTQTVPITPTLSYNFTTTPATPADIYVRAQDTDNISSLRATPLMSAEGGIKIVSGRIKASNAYGSELLPLRMTATVQYYTVNGWVGSTTDSVTTLKTLASPYNLLNAAGATTGTTAATFVVPTDAACLPYVSGTICKDSATINLAKPNPGGSAGVATITPEIVGCATPATCYLQVIPGTATFGIYKNNNNFIYRRER